MFLSTIWHSPYEQEWFIDAPDDLPEGLPAALVAYLAGQHDEPLQYPIHAFTFVAYTYKGLAKSKPRQLSRLATWRGSDTSILPAEIAEGTGVPEGVFFEVSRVIQADEVDGDDLTLDRYQEMKARRGAIQSTAFPELDEA